MGAQGSHFFNACGYSSSKRWAHDTCGHSRKKIRLHNCCASSVFQKPEHRSTFGSDWEVHTFSSHVEQVMCTSFPVDNHDAFCTKPSFLFSSFWVFILVAPPYLLIFFSFFGSVFEAVLRLTRVHFGTRHWQLNLAACDKLPSRVLRSCVCTPTSVVTSEQY